MFFKRSLFFREVCLEIYLPSVRFILSSVDETRQLGAALGRSLPAGSVVLLEGDLGTGKTTLVQSMGEALGITDAIVSPTFTLVNEYPEGRVPLYHFDLYRLPPEEVANLYPELYWDGIEVTPGIVAIEWADRLPYRPQRYLHIKLALTPDQQRHGEIQAIGNWELDLNNLLRTSGWCETSH
jgi:tRNA threonylcarbamoyladenosine biosynthesis protein TsaE